uniref:Jumonji domain-containing protein 4 n=1 Tax=Zeugodacus cucurbitae TaxID=28588 RepID=A0A0A1WVG6_ZEUCU
MSDMSRIDLSSCKRIDKNLQTNIIRLCIDEISYNNFYWRFIKQNWPAILTNVSNEWECSHTWISSKLGADATINFVFLKDKIEDCLVPVTICSDKSVSSELSFYDFLNKWEKYIQSSDSDEDCNFPYLKDWHLKSQLPYYEFYHIPKHFSSDWLNEFLTENGLDDYRFVYMGPKNTWTPFHVDVFGSFSWSVNVYGCKKWILLPAGEELKLLDHFKKLPSKINEEALRKSNVAFFVIYQQKNEAIFVPSGWYHQVYNITDTISVNHNWFNAVNIRYIWCNVSENLRKVMNEISDLKNFHNFYEQCQQILHADFGLNICEFLDILCFIAKKRLFMIEKSRGNANNGNIQCLSSMMFHLNDFHICYDLKNIYTLLKTMTQDKIVYNCKELYKKCITFISLLDQYSHQMSESTSCL